MTPDDPMHPANPETPKPPRGRLPALPPISTGNRARRALWQLVWALLYRPSPIAAHRWRISLLRAFGAQITAPAYPYPTTRIWAPWNLTLGKGSCLAGEVDCYNVAPVTLEDHSLVSQKSFLCTASHDFNDAYFPLTGAPITVGEGAWVAAEAFVGPGVEIGAGAVVLARGVVVREVPKDAIVGGNPARPVSTRSIRQPDNTERQSP